ncbi:MAG: PKD-like domain-containing protein, partial [Bacteroidales bacterium]
AEITNQISQQTVVSGQFSTDVTFESDVIGSSFVWSSSDDCPGLLNYTTPNSGNLLSSQQIEIIDPNGPETCIITYNITPTINDCPGISYEYKIYVQQQPILFNVTGGGQVCAGGTASVYLSGSQLGVNYQLLRNGTIPVQPEQIGNDNPLQWSGISQSGIYSIVGINQSNMVQAFMIGQVAVIVNPLPQVFAMVPQGDRCAPEIPRLSGSQEGVRYQLLRDGQPMQTLDGTGLPGFLIFDEQTIGGTYTIKAQFLTTLCERTMQGSLIIHSQPDDYPINAGGILCVGVTLFIEHSQPGIEYQLWLNDDPIGAFHVGNGDPIYFEQTTLPGNYRVLANDPVWHCDSFLSQVVVINPTPLQFEVSPKVCCPGVCDIILNGWQPGVSYYLYFEDNAKQPKGMFIAGPFIGIPGEVNINFGVWWDEGTYTVMAKNDSECEIWMLDQTIIKPAPDIFNLIPNGAGCGDQEIVLDGSELGVEYYLYKDLQFEFPVSGTGSPLSFGVMDITGVYSVKAKFVHPEAECWSQMNGSYEIAPFPTSFIVNPLPGTYCPCVNPTLSSSQTGIDYFIQNTTLGTESIAYPGTGN